MGKYKKKYIREQSTNNKLKILGVSKELFLNLGYAFLILAATQIGEVKKAYLKEKGEYQFFMILFIISISISCIFFGIYFGIKIAEKRMNKNNSSL